jgi:hypothetical protein
MRISLAGSGRTCGEIDVTRFTGVLLSVLTVIVALSVAVAALYVYVLPTYYPGPGWGTYLPLQLGVLLAMIIGGCIGYLAPKGGPLRIKIGAALGLAITVALFVSFLSMLIIVNTRGE